MNDAVRLLFQELADLSSSERENLFRERQTPANLRAEVESLLTFDSPNEHGLTARAGTVAEEALRFSEGGQVRQCGPYRLGKFLGAGGMGSVYLAERSDGEIQQKVAVKLLHAPSTRPA
jgi:hypothetical protein